MKKVLVVLAACLLLFGVAGRAMASFADGDLIRVVYDKTGTVEVGSDLGSMSAILANPSLLNPTTNAWNLAGTGLSASWSNLNVAYFAYNADQQSAFWVSGPTSGIVTTSSDGAGTVSSMSTVTGYYGSLSGGTANGIGSQLSLGNSYNIMLNGNGTSNGTFNSFLDVLGQGEKNLAALATGGSVVQGLFQQQVWAPGSTNIADITLTTYLDANGKLATSSTSPVPIPASVLLFVPGLLGFVGIRRRVNI